MRVCLQPEDCISIDCMGVQKPASNWHKQCVIGLQLIASAQLATYPQQSQPFSI